MQELAKQTRKTDQARDKAAIRPSNKARWQRVSGGSSPLTRRRRES
jgi:hypothetical protein